MLKEFAWNTFTKTGNIDAYVFYRELSDRRKNTDEPGKPEEEVVAGK